MLMKIFRTVSNCQDQEMDTRIPNRAREEAAKSLGSWQINTLPFRYIATGCVQMLWFP